MDNSYMILVINPGSTHDEVAVYKGNTELFKESTNYSVEDLSPFDDQGVTSQYEFRKENIKRVLNEKKIDLNDIDAVIGRGGLLHPIPGGVFKINDEMLKDLIDGRYGDHPSNLGAILANTIGKAFNKPAFIADSVVVDELSNLARYSGLPEITRRSIFHCLNQKRVGRLAAQKLGKDYNECRMIVMHAGGGITIGAHYEGKVVDVNNGLDGEGPMTPQRAGTVPAGPFVDLCFSGKYKKEELKQFLTRKGGLRAYLGTSDLKVIVKYIKGEPLPGRHNLKIDEISPEKAKEVLEAMCYQTSKTITSMAAVLEGKIDAIVLSGGIMYENEFCVPWITNRVSWIAPVMVFPGGDEMRALHDAACRALSGEELPQEYKAWD